MADKKVPESAADAPRVVRATQMVFYGGMRIRAGKTFTLKRPATEFNPKCMVVVDAEDETAKAVESSPKTRGSAGVMLKQVQATPATAVKTATLDPDPGI